MLTLDQVKSKSATRLKGLHPAVLAAANALIERSYSRGVPILITQGLRTVAEQDALYAQGRTKPGGIVTNARGGFSYHNYGLAVDFALLLPDASNVSWDMKRNGNKDGEVDWLEVVQEAKALGFEWGGDWTSFKDYPHLQMSFGLGLAELRAGKRPTETQIAVMLAKIERYTREAAAVNKDVKVDVYVNGVKVGAGILDAGVTYLPVRVVAEALGATVGWNKENLRVDITKEAK
ncbi:M15 family metallopeptidase [Paenibacillus sp. FSL R7-0337]|uniref:M15 family metallopeptidase n=1 Tax=Paenibacillus sp. FSL R7-0337 TaxID=1926588 RepID=UPI00096D23C9|nr:M15 family metallopeptidase [Paenibacillus sp. FSL R7-0337]OMF98169.1 hypothetical protein BK147_11145 [Paenibacillus sp. FSL R7-0337]